MDLKNWLRAQWDRALAAAAVLVGALALLLGYLGVRDGLYPGEQIPYLISGGMFGLFAVGLGTALWLSADLRDEWSMLEEIDDKLSAVLDAVHDAGPAAVSGGKPPRLSAAPLPDQPHDSGTPEGAARPTRRRSAKAG